jgi:hypothetical protein
MSFRNVVTSVAAFSSLAELHQEETGGDSVPDSPELLGAVE